MFRKNYFTFLLSIALFLVGGSAAFAQSAPVVGKIEVKKADGTTAPVAGALIQVYREDNKAKFPTDTTDKKGNFAFAGLALGSRYVLVVSGPGISPYIYPGVPPGQPAFTIIVSEGDGKVFTEAEVREALATKTKPTLEGTNTSKNAELTAEQKKAKEEEDKKILEVKSKNEKTLQRNVVVQAALEAGAKAFEAKDYDLAILKFEEGYQANPEFVGSAPLLLNNKALSLTNRAVENFKKTSTIADITAKIEAFNKVTKDFAEAVETYNKAWTILKNAPTGSVTDPKIYEANKAQTLNGAIEVVKYMVTSERIDSSKTGAVKLIMGEYINVESDAAKKLAAQISLGDIYRLAADSDNAVIEYRKALEMSADNPDALAGLGLSLFNSGEINNNVAQKQEGLGYMERFTQVAPDNHKLKSSVADAVTYLKSQKIVPQKVTTTKKKN